ncbi:MAG: polysaccharide deacetylase family protein [Clostridia bacterium]|nr:polysaccharide deacetylase family protein [Clostridia bacterium]
MNNLHLRFPNGLAKCLTLSYDDGVEQDMRMCELMKKYGIAGTFNISTGNYSPEGKRFEPGRVHRPMTQRQSLETYKDEPLFEVATHALHHAWLPDIPLSEAVHEIIEDRRNIESQYGTICRGHAYPYGKYSENIINVLKSCGIAYARTTVSTHKFSLPENWLILNPTCHHKDPRLTELTDNFLNETPKLSPLFFYLWGHTFEFESDNNWEIIERFFEKTGGNPDIWYATNIEVYDYVQAFNSLIFSADGKNIFNPTCTDVWISLNSKSTCKIPKGEAVSL